MYIILEATGNEKTIVHEGVEYFVLEPVTINGINTTVEIVGNVAIEATDVKPCIETVGVETLRFCSNNTDSRLLLLGAGLQPCIGEASERLAGMTKWRPVDRTSLNSIVFDTTVITVPKDKDFSVGAYGRAEYPELIFTQLGSNSELPEKDKIRVLTDQAYVHQSGIWEGYPDYELRDATNEYEMYGHAAYEGSTGFMNDLTEEQAVFMKTLENVNRDLIRYVTSKTSIQNIVHASYLLICMSKELDVRPILVMEGLMDKRTFDQVVLGFRPEIAGEEDDDEYQILKVCEVNDNQACATSGKYLEFFKRRFNGRSFNELSMLEKATVLAIAPGEGMTIACGDVWEQKAKVFYETGHTRTYTPSRNPLDEWR